MSRAYYLECEQALPDSLSDCCFHPEYGRVRSVAFIHKSYLPNILATPGDATIWQGGMNLGKVVLIRRTSGTFEPGEPAKLKGYGRRISTHGYRNMTVSFYDPALVENAALYNYLDRSTNYAVAFRTATQIFIFDRVADIIVKNPVEEDLDSLVQWNVTCSTRSFNLPLMADANSILPLFICTPQPGTDFLITEDGIVIVMEDGTPILGH